MKLTTKEEDETEENFPWAEPDYGLLLGEFDPKN